MVMARIVAAWPGHVVCPRAYASGLCCARVIGGSVRRGQPLHADHPRVADLVAQRVEVLIRGAVVEALEGLPRGELQQHEPVRRPVALVYGVRPAARQVPAAGCFDLGQDVRHVLSVARRVTHVDVEDDIVRGWGGLPGGSCVSHHGLRSVMARTGVKSPRLLAD